MNSQFFDINGRIVDYYTLFNIPYDADIKEINTAFHTLIMRYHPDTAKEKIENDVEKIDFILRGHRILTDAGRRKEYDRCLFRDRAPVDASYLVIPQKRVKYSASLGKMLKARIKLENMKRKDILWNIGQDVEIIITHVEAKKGATAYIELPARMNCPICFGRESQCHVCSGVGRIHTTANLKVTIPAGIRGKTYMDFDLIKLRPDRFTTFRTKHLRIKISVMR